MDMTAVAPVLPLIYALLAAGGAFAATRVTLNYHEKWLERHDKELDEVREEHKEDVRRIHERIDQLKAKI